MIAKSAGAFSVQKRVCCQVWKAYVMAFEKPGKNAGKSLAKPLPTARPGEERLDLLVLSTDTHMRAQ
jgi:hypothetical protein